MPYKVTRRRTAARKSRAAPRRRSYAKRPAYKRRRTVARRPLTRRRVARKTPLNAVIRGNGDYSISGTIMSGSTPKMHNSKGGIVISHCEYISDIATGTGTPTAFNIDGFPINPGISSTFPWLSQVAQNFEEYQIKGMAFHYKSLSVDAIASTSVNLGAVIMATDYNVNHGLFNSKAAMENYEFSVSAKPSVSMLHPIEVKPSQTVLPRLYVRTEGQNIASQDQRLFDIGLFQIATQGLPAAAKSIGELWVTYEIEFFKPSIPSGPSSVEGCTARWDCSNTGTGWTNYNNALAGGGTFGYRGGSLSSSSSIPVLSPSLWSSGFAGPTIFDGFLVSGDMQPNTSTVLPGQPQPGQVGFLVPGGVSPGLNEMYFMYDVVPHLYWVHFSYTISTAAAAAGTITTTNSDVLPTPNYLRGVVSTYTSPPSGTVCAQRSFDFLISVPALGTFTTNCGNAVVVDAAGTGWGTPQYAEVMVTRVF